MSPQSNHNIKITKTNLPGLDIERGLITTQQNTGLYLRLIDKFYDKQMHFSTEFKDALKTNIEDAERTAHSLKGNAGNLGMTSLFETAKELEFACKDNADNIEQILEKVLSELSVVQNSIETLKASINNPETTASNTDNTANNVDILTQLITELYGYLSTNNIKSGDTLKKIEPLIANTAQSGLFEQVVNSVDDYDFSEALETLIELAKQLDISIQ